VPYRHARSPAGREDVQGLSHLPVLTRVHRRRRLHGRQSSHCTARSMRPSTWVMRPAGVIESPLARPS
jgi:hypothetical protein